MTGIFDRLKQRRSWREAHRARVNPFIDAEDASEKLTNEELSEKNPFSDVHTLIPPADSSLPPYSPSIVNKRKSAYAYADTDAELELEPKEAPTGSYDLRPAAGSASPKTRASVRITIRPCSKTRSTDDVFHFDPLSFKLIDNGPVVCFARHSSGGEEGVEHNGSSGARMYHGKVLFRNRGITRDNHAQMWCEGGKVYVQDSGSTGGTLLNGNHLSRRPRTVSRPHLIRDGDVLRLGSWFSWHGQTNKLLVKCVRFEVSVEHLIVNRSMGMSIDWAPLCSFSWHIQFVRLHKKERKARPFLSPLPESESEVEVATQHPTFIGEKDDGADGEQQRTLEEGTTFTDRFPGLSLLRRPRTDVDPNSAPSIRITLQAHTPDEDSFTFDPVQFSLVSGGESMRLCRYEKDPADEYAIGFKSLTLTRNAHAQIWCEDKMAFIQDTGSSGGTFLNEKRLIDEPISISPPFQLADGDIIQIGRDYHGEVNDGSSKYKCVRAKVKIELLAEEDGEIQETIQAEGEGTEVASTSIDEE